MYRNQNVPQTGCQPPRGVPFRARRSPACRFALPRLEFQGPTHTPLARFSPSLDTACSAANEFSLIFSRPLPLHLLILLEPFAQLLLRLAKAFEFLPQPS